jgi:DNA-binding MarR family transcriptional regulator
MTQTSSSLPDLVHAVARGLRRSWIQSLEPHGITPHEWRALHTVAKRTSGPDASSEEPLRQRDLAEALRITPRSAAEVVCWLEELGLVRRSPHPSDKRALAVAVTKHGREVEAQIETLRSRSGDEYFAMLPAEDADELARILSQVLEEHPIPPRGHRH